MRNTSGIVAVVVILLVQPLCAHADGTGTPVDESVAQVIKAAGGEERLLGVFRFHERVLLNSRTPQERQWYQTDILELVPLKELPSGLK